MEEFIIAYKALNDFVSEDRRVFADKGKTISVFDWESLSWHDQMRFEPVELRSTLEKVSLEAGLLSSHLEGVAKFGNESSWKVLVETYKRLKELMDFIEMGRNFMLQKAAK